MNLLEKFKELLTEKKVTPQEKGLLVLAAVRSRLKNYYALLFKYWDLAEKMEKELTNLLKNNQDFLDPEDVKKLRDVGNRLHQAMVVNVPKATNWFVYPEIKGKEKLQHKVGTNDAEYNKKGRIATKPF